MTFEEAVQQTMFSRQQEKTFIDKLLAREDTERLRDLMKKTEWKRSELLEVLYILGGTEAKLVNYGEWDRYICLKFFVWLREFVKIGELLYDYQDDLKKKENTCKNCHNEKKECSCGENKFEAMISLSPRAKQLFYNNQRLIEHNIKFMVDLYLNISRTTLSLGATGILELLKNKFEMSYPEQALIASQASQQNQQSWWGKITRKGG